MHDNEFRNQLDREARQLPVTSTGIDAIIGSATARTRRRRTLAAAGGVLALVAATVVGVQQLSQVDDGSIALDAPDDGSAQPDTSGDVVAPAPVTTVVVAPTSVPGFDVDVPAVFDAALPAARSESQMTWTVVDSESPEALALRYGSAGDRYALTTEPGSVAGSRALYEHRDGEWVQIGRDVLPDGLRQATVSGDAVYAIGTAPATAGGDPGAVGRYDIAAEEWSLIPLPDGFRTYRSDAVRTSQEMTIAPYTEGAIVAITTYGAAVDYRVLEAHRPGLQMYAEPRWLDGALEVATGCDSTAMDRAMNAAEIGATSAVEYQTAMHDALAAHCTIERLTAAELGLSDADVAALSTPRSAGLWTFDGTTLTPVDLPDPTAESARLSDGVLVTDAPDGRRTWIVGEDGSFVEVFAGLANWAGTEARVHDGVASVGAFGVVVTETPGGSSTMVDLVPVVTDGTMVDPSAWVSSVAATGNATVALVAVEYDTQSSITEPTTFTASGYELRVDPERGITVIDQSTGRPADFGYRLATASGSITLLRSEFAGGPDAGPDATSTTTVAPGGVDATAPDASTTTSTTIAPVPEATTPGTVPVDGSYEEEVLAEFDVDPTTLPPWTHRFEQRLVSSIDGRSFAVESLADLVGATADEVVDTFRTEVVDGRFVLQVWVRDATGTGEGRSLVLVGTPNG